MSLPPPPGRLLEDGHVEWTHDCNGVPVTATLPMPPWRVVGHQVEPSVHCTACGMHGWVQLVPSPAFFREAPSADTRLPLSSLSPRERRS